ncbi:MAG: hypothetical protein HYR66_09405, partial [Sphingobacteriales bacterium]|nr:hypothetical protein [Sphingobacteriales bacterium]
MDKNLQNIDDVFNSAYNSFEEEPSDSTWEKLNAALDKEDAEKYKRRFIGWKRIAALLFFLLASFMIYETGIIVNRKKDSGITNRESLSDSTLVKDKIDYHKKKTAAEYVSISPETKKSRLKGDSTIAFQSLKVLQETNQNKKTAPVVKLQPNSPINQPETVTVVSKHGNKNRKPERGITKFSVKSGVTGQGETQLFAANNSINDQVNRDREMIKDKQLVKNTDKEKDSIRRPGILP